MNSNTLKRTAATLGVVAGLLAAAGPANAQILDGPLMPKASGYNFKGEVIGLEPTALGTQVGSEGVYFDLEWEAEGIIMRDGGKPVG
jgi:hypothetical protein